MDSSEAGKHEIYILKPRILVQGCSVDAVRKNTKVVKDASPSN